MKTVGFCLFCVKRGRRDGISCHNKYEKEGKPRQKKNFPGTNKNTIRTYISTENRHFTGPILKQKIPNTYIYVKEDSKILPKQVGIQNC